MKKQIVIILGVILLMQVSFAVAVEIEKSYRQDKPNSPFQIEYVFNKEWKFTKQWQKKPLDIEIEQAGEKFLQEILISSPEAGDWLGRSNIDIE